ncbi:restriction endonuclease subunit S [Stenotrophomonas maltophilia]|uniref:restriction endonuclease subunit S n=1 Tax=Stenotrophomonas maltophilia TaxID=40324 RepID=UPI0039C4084E
MTAGDFLERLLDGVAVEWVALGDVAKYSDVRIDCTGIDERNYVGVDNLLQNGAGKAESTYVPSEGRLIEYRPGDVLIGNIRPYLKKIWLADQSGGTNGDVLVVRSIHEALNPGYLYQLLTDESFFDYNMQHAKGAKMPRGDKARILEYKIPIPCPSNPSRSLEIQAEIVRVLGAFTELIDELNVELAARKKQYNYYRDRLLNFDEGEAEWKTLGDVALIQRGASPRPISKFITEDETGVPWIKIGDTTPGSKYVNGTAQKITQEGARSSRVLDKGDFILSNSMSFGRPYILGISGAIHDGWASISKFSNVLSSHFLYHYLSSSSVKSYWAGKINSGSVSNLNADIIKALPVPVPSLAQQNRIAALLDKFDALTNSVAEGLPREIELRKKQYSYYRNLLLSFPKSDEVKA